MQAAFPADDLDLVLSLTPEFWSRFGGARLFMTGGTGFIGGWLLQSLQRANDTLGSRIELVVLSRDPERARRKSPHVFDRRDTRLIAGDVRDFAAPAGQLDLLVHAAADVGDPHRVADPLAKFDSIVLGTRRALELADASGASRFLLTSSGAVYGIQPASIERVAETHAGAPDPLDPNAAYGNGKRAAEWLAGAYAAQSGLGACAARIYALIGPGLPLNGPFAAGNFISNALAGQTIEVKGDGRPLRSFLYMADLCVWLLRILGAGAPGQAYNVGSEHAVSIAELARQVARASGSAASPLIQAPTTAGPALRYLPDTLKARDELGLAEYTPLDAALRKTIDWSRSSMKP
jgi:nucleoside-diphosphate-sugar epimerase